MADAPLAEEDRPAINEPDGERRADQNREHQRQHGQRHQPVHDGLQVEVTARGNQRAEAILRQMVELHPAGKRLQQGLELIDDDPGKGRIREQALPLRRQFGGEVGDQGVTAVKKLDPGARQLDPAHPDDRLQPKHPAERNHADPQHLPSLHQEIDEV